MLSISPLCLPTYTVTQEMVAARFAKLVAEGLPPNQAAAQAISSLQQEAAALAAAPPLASPSASSSGNVDGNGNSGSGSGPGPWQSELEELGAMGFMDTQKNIGLLEKYQGRLVRVVNALAGGD